MKKMPIKYVSAALSLAFCISIPVYAKTVSKNPIYLDSIGNDVPNVKITSTVPDKNSNKIQHFSYGKYSGWVCGMTENARSASDADVLLIHPETKKVKKLTTLKDVDAAQTCAVSSDGSKIAYKALLSQNASDGVCLCIKDLEKGTTKKYFNDVIQELTLYAY